MGRNRNLPAKTLSELKAHERDARRGVILSAARDLFAKRDFREVTAREIARKAGISIGTLYNYYASLDELFLDIFLESAEEITRLLDRETENGAAASLSSLCSWYIAFLNRNMTFYQMMGHFMLGGDLSPDATRRLNHIMRLLMDRIEKALQAAGVGGDTRLAAHALFSALNGIMISYARYPGREPAAVRRHTLRLADAIAQIFIEMRPLAKTTTA